MKIKLELMRLDGESAHFGFGDVIVRMARRAWNDIGKPLEVEVEINGS